MRNLKIDILLEKPFTSELLWIFLYKRIRDKSHRSKDLILQASYFKIFKIFPKSCILLDPLTFEPKSFAIDCACSLLLEIYLMLQFLL